MQKKYRVVFSLAFLTISSCFAMQQPTSSYVPSPLDLIKHKNKHYAIAELALPPKVETILKLKGLTSDEIEPFDFERDYKETQKPISHTDEIAFRNENLDKAYELNKCLKKSKTMSFLDQRETLQSIIIIAQQCFLNVERYHPSTAVRFCMLHNKASSKLKKILDRENAQNLQCRLNDLLEGVMPFSYLTRELKTIKEIAHKNYDKVASYNPKTATLFISIENKATIVLRKITAEHAPIIGLSRK